MTVKARVAGIKLQRCSELLSGEDRKGDKAGSRGPVTGQVTMRGTRRQNSTWDRWTKTHSAQATTVDSGWVRAQQTNQDPTSD